MTDNDAGPTSEPDRTPAPAEESTVHIEDGVLHVHVSSAEHGSSLNGAAMADGTRALSDLDPDVGAVLLVGAVPNFCAGGNVHAFAAAENRGEYVREVAEQFHAFVLALNAVTVPVVAGVQGWAAGAGMSLVLHTDIAIGGRSTKFRPAYSALGFTPDGGMTHTLPRVVGDRRARDILLSDAVIGSDEAFRLGLLTRLVGDDVIASEAGRLARSLAAGPSETYCRTKSLVASADTRTLAEQLAAETDAISTMAGSPIGIEGVDAFVEKRRPDFKSAAER